MNDLISRQAAIRFIRDKVSLSLFMKRSVDKADKACMELCDMLDKELPSAQQWIPCSEKLPDDGTYLCWEWQGFCYVDSFKNGKWETAEKCYTKCLAWMPLPAPYKEETEPKSTTIARIAELTTEVKQMDEIKLKPCPFCGGEPYFYTKSIGEENGALSFYFRIACRRCQSSPNNAYGDIKIHLLDNGELSISPDDRKKVSEEWNRRATG